MLPKIDGAVGTNLHAAVATDAAPMVAFRPGMEGNDSGGAFFPAETATDAALRIESDSQPGKEPRKINQIGEICRQGFLEGQAHFTTVADGLDLGAPDPGIPVRIDLVRFEAHHLGGNDIRGTGGCTGHDQAGSSRLPAGTGSFSLQPHNTVDDIQLRSDLALQPDEEPGKGSGIGQCLVISLLEGAGDASIEILHAEGYTRQTVGLHLGDIDDAIHLKEDFGQGHGSDLASKRHETPGLCFKIDQAGITRERLDIADIKGTIRIIKRTFSDQDLRAGRFEDLTELFQNDRMCGDRSFRFDRGHKVGLDQDPHAWLEGGIQMRESLRERLAHPFGVIGITTDATDTIAIHSLLNIQKTDARRPHG